MRMIRAMNENGDWLTGINQYDRNAYVYLSDDVITESCGVHFAPQGVPIALTATTTYADGILCAKIPNCLLDIAGMMVGYVYLDEDDGTRNTLLSFRIHVEKRARPDDLICESDEDYLLLANAMSQAANSAAEAGEYMNASAVSANAAAASESNAATYAGAAATSESNALTYASGAAISESNAAANAAAASASANASTVSANAAAASESNAASHANNAAANAAAANAAMNNAAASMNAAAVSESSAAISANAAANSAAEASGWAIAANANAASAAMLANTAAVSANESAASAEAAAASESNALASEASSKEILGLLVEVLAAQDVDAEELLASVNGVVMELNTGDGGLDALIYTVDEEE